MTKRVDELLKDTRTVLEPFTAKNLKVRRENVVKDFVSVASLLKVTHILMFTTTEKAVYLRLIRLPKGPTLTYRIIEFTNARVVRSSIRRPMLYDSLFRKQPLMIMNGFSQDHVANGSNSGLSDLELKLQASMWRNLFPAFNMESINLNDIKRSVLMNYDSYTNTIDFRHYSIRLKPIGITKTVKKLLISKKVPNLGKFGDFTQVLDRDGMLTESEGEEDSLPVELASVTVPENVKGKGVLANDKSAVKLTEIGPRITFSLFKIESGVMEGEILYHSVVKKTKQEIDQLKIRKEKQQKEKAERKRIQEENVKRKQEALEAKRAKKILKKQAKKETPESENVSLKKRIYHSDSDDNDDDDDEDVDANHDLTTGDETIPVVMKKVKFKPKTKKIKN